MHLYIYIAAVFAAFATVLTWSKLFARRGVREQNRFRMIVGMPVPSSVDERMEMNGWVEAILTQHKEDLRRTIRAQMEAEQVGNRDAIIALRSRREEQEGLYDLACRTIRKQGFSTTQMRPAELLD